MLTLVKQWIGADTPRAAMPPDMIMAALRGLQDGAAVQFGSTPQENLSGRRYRVTGTQTYWFGEECFLSHRLQSDGQADIFLIAAERSGEEYLAISRAVTEEDQDILFGAQPLFAMPEKPALQQVRCRDTVIGFKGWLTGTYRKQLDRVRGSVLPGDRRDLSQGETDAVARERGGFHYALLVNATNEHAVEIEKHDDGRVQIFVTVFRPLSDIVQVIPPERPTRLVPRPWANDASNIDTVIEALKKRREVMVQPAPRAEIIQHPATVRAREADTNMVACDVRVAVKVIEEAVLNKMSIAEVVRRVVDLPVSFNEKVFFDIPLSPADYEVLGHRYGISTDDKRAIRARMAQELAEFTGER